MVVKRPCEMRMFMSIVNIIKCSLGRTNSLSHLSVPPYTNMFARLMIGWHRTDCRRETPLVRSRNSGANCLGARYHGYTIAYWEEKWSDKMGNNFMWWTLCLNTWPKTHRIKYHRTSKSLNLTIQNQCISSRVPAAKLTISWFIKPLSPTSFVISDKRAQLLI